MTSAPDDVGSNTSKAVFLAIFTVLTIQVKNYRSFRLCIGQKYDTFMSRSRDNVVIYRLTHTVQMFR